MRGQQNMGLDSAIWAIWVAIMVGLFLASDGEPETFVRYQLIAAGIGAAGIVLLSAAVLVLQWLNRRLP